MSEVDNVLNIENALLHITDLIKNEVKIEKKDLENLRKNLLGIYKLYHNLAEQKRIIESGDSDKLKNELRVLENIKTQLNDKREKFRQMYLDLLKHAKQEEVDLNKYRTERMAVINSDKDLAVEGQVAIQRSMLALNELTKILNKKLGYAET